MNNVRPWTWAVFAFTTLASVIFAILCWFTYEDLRGVSNALATQPTSESISWSEVFKGAAASAFFAVVLVVLFLVLAVYYMVLSMKPLGHPRSKYGKGVMIGSSSFIALHVCNIAAQFYTFTGATGNLNYNGRLLTATYVFGFISTFCFALFSVMLALWHDKAAETLEQQALSRSDLYGVQMH